MGSQESYPASVFIWQYIHLGVKVCSKVLAASKWSEQPQATKTELDSFEWLFDHLYVQYSSCDWMGIIPNLVSSCDMLLNALS